MSSRAAVAWVAVLALAAVLSVVLITTLLLFGVDPHSVFLPGHLVLAGLGAIGVDAPNSVGVVVTAATWWALIVLMWLALRQWMRRRA